MTPSVPAAVFVDCAVAVKGSSALLRHTSTVAVEVFFSSQLKSASINDFGAAENNFPF